SYAFGGLRAQEPSWQPSPGHTQMPIWPAARPDVQQGSAREIVTTTGNEHLVAGRPWSYISNVSRPTITVYSPKEKNTGAAVVVFPGGGYQILAIDLEGTEVCDWLTIKGITCVLVKYRVPMSARHGISNAAVIGTPNPLRRWRTPCGPFGSCGITPSNGTLTHTRSVFLDSPQA